MLLREEEEQAVLVLVVAAERHGTAELIADVALTVDRLEAGRRGRIGLERLAAIAVVDPRVRVHAFMPAIPVGGAAILAAAALGHQADLRAGRAAVFRRVGAGQQLELLDRFQVDRAVDAVVAGIDVADAVDGDVVRVVTAAVDVHAGADRVGHARRETREQQRIAAVDGEIGDGGRVDRERSRRRRATALRRRARRR